MCINKINNYHILYTNMLWLLLQPSSRGHTRIQTIYKQLYKMYNRNHSMLQLTILSTPCSHKCQIMLLFKRKIKVGLVTLLLSCI